MRYVRCDRWAHDRGPPLLTCIKISPEKFSTLNGLSRLTVDVSVKFIDYYYYNNGVEQWVKRRK